MERIATGERQPPPSVLVPDYVDLQLLNTIAPQLGISIETLQIEETQEGRTTEEIGSKAGAELGIPGTKLSGELTEKSLEERAAQQRVAFERRRHIHSIIEDVIRELEERGHLRRDLAEIPPGVELEVRVREILFSLAEQWGVVPLLAELAPDDANKRMSAALGEITATAGVLVGDALEARWRELESEGVFVLIEGSWEIEDTTDDLVLSFARLQGEVQNPVAAAMPARVGLEVAVRKGDVVGARLAPGSTREARVLGRTLGIGSSMRSGGETDADLLPSVVLKLEPLAVFSRIRV